MHKPSRKLPRSVKAINVFKAGRAVLRVYEAAIIGVHRDETAGLRHEVNAALNSLAGVKS